MRRTLAWRKCSACVSVGFMLGRSRLASRFRSFWGLPCDVFRTPPLKLVSRTSRMVSQRSRGPGLYHLVEMVLSPVHVLAGRLLVCLCFQDPTSDFKVSVQLVIATPGPWEGPEWQLVGFSRTMGVARSMVWPDIRQVHQAACQAIPPCMPAGHARHVKHAMHTKQPEPHPGCHAKHASHGRHARS